jgi:hypothetical protein
MSEEMNRLGDLSAGEREFAEALASVAPAASGVDRDGMMFAAGRASVRRGGSGPWKLAVVVALVAMGGMWVLRPTRTVTVERVVEVPGVAPAPLAVVSAAMSFTPEFDAVAEPAASEGELVPYLRLRRTVLAYGLDALPQPATYSSGSLPSPALGHDALESLPRWQRRALLVQGDRS